jgi:hypothetical protein
MDLAYPRSHQPYGYSNVETETTCTPVECKRDRNVLAGRIILVYSIANIDMLYKSQPKELRFS